MAVNLRECFFCKKVDRHIVLLTPDSESLAFCVECYQKAFDYVSNIIKREDFKYGNEKEMDSKSC